MRKHNSITQGINIPIIGTMDLLRAVRVFIPYADLGNDVSINYKIDMEFDVNLQRLVAFMQILDQTEGVMESDKFAEDVKALLTSLEKQIQNIRYFVDA